MASAFESAAQYSRSPVWVYAHTSMESLADDIVKFCIEGCPKTPTTSQVNVPCSKSAK